jgi:hypothetical protein
MSQAKTKTDATAEIMKKHENIKRAIRESLHQNRHFEKEMSRFAFIGIITQTIICSFNLDGEYKQWVKGLVIDEMFTPARENLI